MAVKKKEEEPKPISDKKLAEMGRARDRLRLQKKELEVQMLVIDTAILGELNRRGTKLIESTGVRVTRVAQERTSYSYDLLRELLGKKAGRYRPRTVDVPALSRGVQAGDVPPDIIDKITVVTENSPYVAVSFTAP